MSGRARPVAPAPAFPVVTRLRLVTRAVDAKGRVRPPLGVTRWSDEEGADVAVVLDRSDAEGGPSLEAVAGQLPAAVAVRPGALVVVLGELAPRGGILSRLLGPRPVATRAVRSSALLALGYERLGGGVEPQTGRDLAWGFAPVSTED